VINAPAWSLAGRASASALVTLVGLGVGFGTVDGVRVTEFRAGGGRCGHGPAELHSRRGADGQRFEGAGRHLPV
jgi:hypothetical protein